jgi:hypothetical protein
MFQGSKARPVRKARNFIAIYEPIAKTMWDSQYLTTLQAPKACYLDSFNFTFTIFFQTYKLYL